MADEKDPRLKGEPKKANDIVQDRNITRAVAVEGVKKRQIRDLLKKVNSEIFPNFIDKIRRKLSAIEGRRASRARKISSIEKVVDSLTADVTDEIKKEALLGLVAFSSSELEFVTNKLLSDLAIDIKVGAPTKNQFKKEWLEEPFDGLNLDQWFSTLQRSTKDRVLGAAQQGFAEGRTTDQIVRELQGTRRLRFKDGVLETTRRQTQAVVRTAMNHIASQARMEIGERNQDIIKGYKWVSVLDSRTTVICAGLDGKVFIFGEEGNRVPPAHVGCRSTTTFVLRSANQFGLKDLTPGQRASFDGQVPGDVTYGAWLKGQPVSVQEMVLGKKKSILFRKGELPIERFTDKNLMPLTLEELAVKEKAAFEKSGLQV
jgi:SPP1 gp7 family putative phage head morphogenesis protein